MGKRCVEDLGAASVRVRRAALAATALIGATALLAGCGGGSPGSGVASLGSHTSSTATGSVSAGGASSGGESAPGSQAIAYAACMRSHGVPNFPDPQISQKGGGVSVRMAVPASIGGNPKFKSADHDCQKLLPAGGPGNQPVIGSAEQAKYLKAAACIRTHGVPNFPDPTFSGGGVHLDHKDLNESSPVFVAAVHACESLIPGGVHGGPGSSHQAAPSP